MTDLFPSFKGTGDGEDQEQRGRHAVNEVLAGAGEAGRAAAGWVRSLAARQAEGRHCTVLERAADAIERASGREVVPWETVSWRRSWRTTWPLVSSPAARTSRRSPIW